MQKKSLLYVFALAAFLGLVLGAGFFANELRIKIMAGPDKDQFEEEQTQLPGLADIIIGKGAGKNNPGTANSSVPKPPAAPPQVQPVPQPPEESTDAKALEEKKDSFSFAILGDTQKFDPDKTDGGLQQAVKSIKEKNPELVLAGGDLMSSCDGGSGCEDKLKKWKDTLGDLFSKTYPVMGNHDRSGEEKSDKLWQKFFDLPKNGPEGYEELAFSFDFENSHFVVLNSEKPKEHIVDENQRDWLEKDLSDNKKGNTFVFFHEPAYPVSNQIGKGLDAEEEERDALWKILKDHKVTSVFSGYERIQSRRKIDGVYQFIFGNTDSSDQDTPKAGVAEYSYKGKHYGLVEVSGKEVTVKVYSVDGNLLDSYKLPG